jgi:hypothetical protein
MQEVMLYICLIHIFDLYAMHDNSLKLYMVQPRIVHPSYKELCTLQCQGQRRHVGDVFNIIERKVCYVLLV